MLFLSLLLLQLLLLLLFALLLFSGLTLRFELFVLRLLAAELRAQFLLPLFLAFHGFAALDVGPASAHFDVDRLLATGIDFNFTDAFAAQGDLACTTWRVRLAV